MSGIKDYSTTPASNNATPPNGFPEGMAPASLNDGMRQVMADIRSWYEDPAWINLGHTPTYSSTTAFTLSGDKTTTYAAGVRIKASGTTPFTIYGTISSSSYSAPNTTVNVTWDSGTLNATLNAVSLNLVQSALGGLSLTTGTITTLTSTTANIATANISTALNVTGGSAAISGTSSEAAYVTFAEDTDNGTNKVKVQAPSLLASDVTVTLPSSAGTLALTSQAIIPAVSYAETTAVATITATIPYDDTIPQISEGTQILSLAHTAVSGTNKLDIALTIQGVNSAGANVVIAVFKDSDVNAVAAGFWSPANEAYGQSFNFRLTAGDTSAHTYTVRLGTSSGTYTLNGTGGARRLGGVCVTSMTIREVTA